eukprot:1662428-Pyramimonas_sp.AAC.1
MGGYFGSNPPPLLPPNHGRSYLLHAVCGRVLHRRGRLACIRKMRVSNNVLPLGPPSHARRALDFTEQHARAQV